MQAINRPDRATGIPPNNALQRTRAAVLLQSVPGEPSTPGRRRAPLSLGPFGDRAAQTFGVCLRSRNVLLAITAVLGLVTQAACGPYVISYRHPCFDEKQGLRVYERSTISRDSQGKRLLFARVGLPIRAKLDRPGYQISVDTPLNPNPVVFLKAVAPDGKRLALEGRNVVPLYPKSGAELEGYQYSFLVDAAKGAPLAIVIRDSAGRVLGSERLSYVLRSRGLAYGIEGT